MSDLLFKSPVQYEPKQTHRFIARFPNDVSIQPFAIKSFNAPKFTNNKVSMGFINTETYVLGRTTWGEITVSARDFIAPSTTQALMEWQRLHHEAVTGRSGYAVGYMKDIDFEILDPAGTAISVWRYETCMLVGETNFGDYTMESDGVVELSFTIQPQRCILLY